MRLGVGALDLVHMVVMLLGARFKLVFSEGRNTLLEGRVARKIGLLNGAASSGEF